MTKRIINMPRASVLEDGSLVEMEFESESGESVTLAFSTKDFDRFVARAAQLLAGARSRTLSNGDHLEIHPVPAVAVMANTPVGGGKVLLSVRADNDVPYHFALSPAEAEALRPQLYRAAKSAKKQASQSRH